MDQPQIVVLDGFTLNPGDLSWKPILQLGRCAIYDRSAPDEVIPRAQDAEIVLTNKTPLDRQTIFSLPELRYIGVLATGYNIVDTVAARERGIPVTNVPGYGTRSVAQMTTALLLELALRTGAHSESVRRGEWCRRLDFCYWEHPLLELSGLTLGLVGFGQIGREVGALGRAFGMEVIAYNPRPKKADYPVAWVELDALFALSDVVSLHCPLTPETKHLVDGRRLALMKQSAFLLNTSRGPLVDEPALAEALNDGRIAGAGLDVLSTEPPPADHPLLRAKNCIVTPHIAWAARASRARLLQGAAENLFAFLSGAPAHVVN